MEIFDIFFAPLSLASFAGPAYNARQKEIIMSNRRRIVSLLVVLIVGLAGFALGQAAPPALKFPWASAEMNAPCGKTELEWRCVAANYDITLPPVNGPYRVERVNFTPTEKGMIARVVFFADSRIMRNVVSPKPGLMEYAFRVRDYVHANIAPLKDKFDNFEVQILEGKNPVARVDAGGITMAK